MTNVKRQIGMEQEFFIVDRSGVIADRADEVLEGCQQRAIEQGRNPENFAPEFVKSMVEINTNPPFLSNGTKNNAKLESYVKQNFQPLFLITLAIV